IVIVALRGPAAVGVKLALIVQLALGASDVPHVLLCAKSPAFGPVRVMLLMASTALPIFVRVTVWTPLVVPFAWLPKSMLFRLRLPVGDCPGPPRGLVRSAWICAVVRARL